MFRHSGIHSRLLVSESGLVIMVGSMRRVPQRNSGGYARISVYHDGKSMDILVHRLVAEACCDGYSNDITVDHIDGNKTNNHYSNLDCVSHHENMRRAWSKGLCSPVYGSKNGRSKIGESGAIYAKCMLVCGYARSKIASDLGVSISTINAIANGRTWLAI